VSEKVEAILESGNYETLTVDFFGSYRVSEKVEAILESGNYETLTVNELFPKLMSSEVDSGGRAKIENPTDPHSLALVSGSRTNANPSSRMYSLSSLMSLPDEDLTSWVRMT
jgi:hypothetical protein